MKSMKLFLTAVCAHAALMLCLIKLHCVITPARLVTAYICPTEIASSHICVRISLATTPSMCLGNEPRYILSGVPVRHTFKEMLP
jgi:hypothetical protein